MPRPLPPLHKFAHFWNTHIPREQHSGQSGAGHPENTRWWCWWPTDVHVHRSRAQCPCGDRQGHSAAVVPIEDRRVRGTRKKHTRVSYMNGNVCWECDCILRLLHVLSQFQRKQHTFTVWLRVAHICMVFTQRSTHTHTITAHTTHTKMHIYSSLWLHNCF